MKKSKGIIIVLILVIIGLLAGGAYAFFMTDLFKTPDQLFKKYLLKSVIDLTQVQYEPYNEILTRMADETTEFNYITSDENGDNEVKVDYLSDPTNKKQKINLSMVVEGKEYLSISAIVADQILGLQMKDIHEKYLALENRDLRTVATNLGISEEESASIPNKIMIAEKFTEEEKQKITELTTKYVSKIGEAINTDYYIVEKQVSVSVNEQTLTADKYSLNIDEKQFSTIVLNTLSELLADQEFLNLCNGRVDTATIEELKTACADSLVELEKQTTSGQIKFALYVTDKVVRKTEMVLDTSSVEWILENKETESTFTLKSVMGKTETNDVASESSFKINNKFENNNGTLTIEESTTYNKDDVEVAENNFSSFYDTEEYVDTNTKTILSTTKTGDKITGKIVLDGYETENEYVTNDFEINFNTNVEIEDLTDENALILNDYSTTEFSSLGTELIMNALNTANEKPNSLVGELSMFLQFFMPTTDDTTNDFTDDSTENLTDSSEDNNFTFSSNETTNIEDTTVAIDVESVKEDIETQITNGLNQSLTEYKDELAVNENANIGDYLTVENVQEECSSSYNLELIDGTTMKCTVDELDVYYVTMDINGDELFVNNIDVYTEQEYSDMQY